MSPELPPAEKVSKLFFIFTLLGAALWIGTISVLVLSQTPNPAGP
ncbi:MAG TPA: hypothetical protein VGO62_20210 [Myxococcota bacterium]|jgi:hypothetical protein